MATSRKRDLGRKYDSGAAKRKKKIARELENEKYSGSLLQYLSAGAQSQTAQTISGGATADSTSSLSTCNNNASSTLPTQQQFCYRLDKLNNN